MSFPETWTAAQYLTAIVKNLNERFGADSNFNGQSDREVVVHSAPLDQEDKVPRNSVAFIDIISDDEAASLGQNRREEEYVLEGIVWVLQRGSDEAAAVLARERATAILAQIEIEVRLNPDAGLNTDVQLVRYSEVIGKTLRQAKQEGYKRAVIEFDIRVKTRI